MHLIVLCQDMFPPGMSKTDTETLITQLSKKVYKDSGLEPGTGWSQIRPRKITIWDFTIPEKVEKQVLEDLKVYCGGGLNKLSEVLTTPLVGSAISKVTGLQAVDMSEIKPSSKVMEHNVYLTILGKLEDKHKGDLEMI